MRRTSRSERGRSGNLGLVRKAASCGISYDVLAWTQEWYVHEETLRAVSLDHGAVAHDGASRWVVLSAVRGAECRLEQFDEVAGGVGKQDLASAGAGYRVASECQSSGA